MIKLDQPAMALNADDVPGARYRMYNTWEVPASAKPEHIFGWCAQVANGTPKGKLEHLVINCHGFYGAGTGGKVMGGFGLKLGTGVNRSNTGVFAALAGKVGKIWITACGTARISGNAAGDGHALCMAIAKQSGAYVVAATTHQVGDLWLPFGYIDEFEGLVVRYNPSGNIEWSHDNGRSLIDGLVNGWQ